MLTHIRCGPEAMKGRELWTMWKNNATSILAKRAAQVVRSRENEQVTERAESMLAEEEERIRARSEEHAWDRMQRSEEAAAKHGRLLKEELQELAAAQKTRSGKGSSLAEQA